MCRMRPLSARIRGPLGSILVCPSGDVLVRVLSSYAHRSRALVVAGFSIGSKGFSLFEVDQLTYGWLWQIAVSDGHLSHI
jgi:hypothetical protein